MVFGSIILLIMIGTPIFLAYEKEKKVIDFTPRYIIVGFLSCIQFVLLIAGSSFLLSIVPWFFAMKVAMKEGVGEDLEIPSSDEVRGNGAQRLDLQPGSDASEDPEKIDNLF